jgi:hypothetical protein
MDVEEAQRTREFLRAYWKDAFPPDDFLHWPIWLVKTFTGNMLAYPIGAKHGGSTVTFLLVLIGSASLWRNGQRSLLALCWLPFGLNFVAAILHKYPFGDSARITLHLAPFLCILMAHGVAEILAWIASPAWRSRVHLAFHVLLLGYGLASIVRDVVLPYKTEHDRDIRLLARDIGRQVVPGERLFLAHNREEELLAEFLWNLRAQALPLRWQHEGIEASVSSYWLVQCSQKELGEVVPLAGWKAARSETRWTPPENHVMPPMFCRWVRMVRE